MEIRTQGDRDQSTALSEIGGVGLFTKEIQNALLDRRIDAAVHSLKDLPTMPVPGLRLAAIPQREDSADALVSHHSTRFTDLPIGARVGTGSPRRRFQLLHLRPDLKIEPIRGNVETRSRRALEGDLDAVVLAVAGLARLGLDSSISDRLEPPFFLPAVGQGALGIECREEDDSTFSILTVLNDDRTRRHAIAERRLLQDVAGGCLIPLAVWARDVDGETAIDAVLFSADGTCRVEASAIGPTDAPEELGSRVAALLREAWRRATGKEVFA